MSTAPMHAEEIEAAKAREKAERLRHTHGYVDKNGDVSQHLVLPPKTGIVGQMKGDCPLLWINGAVQVTERHKKLGGRLLLDVCIADLGEDEGRKKYENWKKAVGYRGTVAIKNPEDLYPPTVHRLRRETDAGISLDKVYDAATGELVPATEEAKAARTADLLDGAGIGRPTADDRDAAKKAKAS